MRSILVVATAALVLPTGLTRPAAAQEPEIQEWPVPYENSRPRDPYVGPDGLVWFVGQRTHYVASLNPQTGAFRKYDLDPGTGPHNLIVDDDGIVWYAGNRAAHIGRLDPATGEITKIMMPDPDARDPHTLVFAPDGNIWFTLQGANMIGHLDVATHDVRLVDVPTPRARPYGIKVDEDGRPWIVLLGTNKLATVDPASMELTEIALPREGARPRRMELVGDRVWMVDYAEGYLVAYDPATMAFEEWLLPAGEDSRPYGTAADTEGRIWIAQTGIDPNVLVGFDTATEAFVHPTAVPSGGGTLRHMYFHAPTGAVWFGADTNTIGRLKVEWSSMETR